MTSASPPSATPTIGAPSSHADESGPRLASPYRAQGRAAARGGDPYAQVLALDTRSLAGRVLGTLAFVGLAVELHVLAKLWVAALTRMSDALDHLPPSWTIVLCAVCGVGSFVVPARGDSRRVLNVVGGVSIFLAVAIGLTVEMLVAGPHMSSALRGELLVDARAAVAGAFAGVVLHAVLASLDALRRGARLAAAIAFAIVVFVPLVVLGHLWMRPAPVDLDSQPIEVTLDDPPPPPPPPPAADPEEPKPEPLKAQSLPLPTAMPLPSPAQAAKVIAVEPDPNKPLDFTNTIIQGTANDYAGGVTSSDGTSTTAVRNTNAQNGGAPNGTGNEANAPAQVQQAHVNRARPAGLMSHDWRCPFPPEADTAQIDEALVMLDITVRPDGTPGAVRITSDPGNGFGRMAYQCAMRQRFVTALDPEGNSIPGVVRAPVHFNR